MMVIGDDDDDMRAVVRMHDGVDVNVNVDDNNHDDNNDSIVSSEPYLVQGGGKRGVPARPL